ncbi:MAG: nucleotidyltransferase domain-containing protein [Methanothrix sp.]|nr:nucleotidyltransferase domain-containing protein [Methanothrix sp.]
MNKIAVFGSFGRGDDSPESDIDILVDPEAAGEKAISGPEVVWP